MKNIVRIFLITLIVSCVSVAVSAATFLVNTTADTQDANPGNGVCADVSSNCSLRAAITEANALAGDDIITLPAGEYIQGLAAADEDNNAGGDWDIRSSITINGAGQATTFLEAAAAPGTASERVLESALGTNIVVINDVTIRYGNKPASLAAGAATRGGGIRNAGTMTINNSFITSNRAPGAGGIRNEGDLALNGVTVSNNICGSTVSQCFGGGLYSANSSAGVVTITGSQFAGNSAAGGGTPVFSYGAGMGIEGTFTLIITDSQFLNNHGTGSGNGGSGGSGLRISSDGVSTANITGSKFHGNFGNGGSDMKGSGIEVLTTGAGSLSGAWDRIAIENSTGILGGGLYVGATGRAITLDISNSTISENLATDGGGVWVTNAGGFAEADVTVNLLNSTISSNTAFNGGTGAGIEVGEPGDGDVVATLSFCTVAGNHAGSNGGGIYVGGSSTLVLKNSVVAGNSSTGSGKDIAGVVNSFDYNHVENTLGTLFVGATTHITTGDASLGALADNSGPTRTNLPDFGSPVIDTIPLGINGCGTTVTVDQRSLPRPSGHGCDRGAVERTALAAGPWSLSGTLRDSGGRPIKNVAVLVQSIWMRTPLLTTSGNLGQYNFSGLPGATYTVGVSSKRFTFTPASRTVDLGANFTDADFTAAPGLSARPASARSRQKARTVKIPERDPCPTATAALCHRYILSGSSR
jgi:CSLREA domain-containing protein